MLFRMCTRLSKRRSLLFPVQNVEKEDEVPNAVLNVTAVELKFCVMSSDAICANHHLDHLRLAIVFYYTIIPILLVRGVLLQLFMRAANLSEAKEMS